MPDATLALRGRVIQPSDSDYDSARALYNAMIDKRPKLIARCVDVADVIAAVSYARDQGLLLAVRGGGHSGPGLGSCDDGLVVDLSLMKGVRVDPANRTVRVDPGCTSGDVDERRLPWEGQRGHGGRQQHACLVPSSYPVLAVPGTWPRPRTLSGCWCILCQTKCGSPLVVPRAC